MEGTEFDPIGDGDVSSIVKVGDDGEILVD
jgi:hypothetical protein